ncbi:hypothetical protein EIP91_001198 [Steccherinum ochraceum]|uniref:DUF6534 domain-containing protein n=1 Tax=Steccherinum ochraceum TaxID=92696 RepID=A0A4R0RPV6_9APHY|nr:hypothetical protein EIP91_001198 [Steccherinum ochraceum]
MGSPAAQTYGPIFIGVVFNIVLYGIMITQTFLYYTVYKRDRLWMKLFVAVLFVCDTLNSVFDLAFLYIPLVTKYGDVHELTYATWVFATDPAMTAIIALLVQMFFAWRVYVLTNSVTAVTFIVACSIGQWCGGMGTAIAVGMVPEFTHFQSFKAIVIVWLTCSAVADTAITIALVWHLRRHKTGFSPTDDAVNRIIRLTVQTGLVTALCAIVDLILFLASPSGLHLIFNLPLSKLYTNSLMSSLNSRAGWQYGSQVGRSVNVNVAVGMEVDSGASSERRRRMSVQKVSNGKDLGGSGAFRKPQEVFIDVESHEMSDRDHEIEHPIHRSKETLALPSVALPFRKHENGSDSDASTIQGAVDRIPLPEGATMYRPATKQ